ncbi:MAG: hypothetical protein EOO42_04350 [Flavobacteriales bacterium]|nr:MAG: hypothetical protein EOO42_04350 [Flavobacteriales bacterium]
MDRAQLNIELAQTMKSICYAPKLSEADLIISIVSTALHLHPDDIKSNSRDHDLADARQIISKILYERQFVYREIGEVLHRDHSTMVIALRRYQDKIDIKDKEFAGKVALVAEEMEALCV